VLGCYFLPRFREAATFAAASAPGCIAVALIQQMFYGSPVRSGYGALAGLFALDHVAPNAARYFSWMSATHTPFWLLALAAPFVLRPRRPATLLLSLALVNVLCYLPYAVFNDWWYLRFLLPGIAMVMVVMIATFEDLVVRLARHPRYRVDGRNITVELRLTPWEAALGASVAVDTPAYGDRATGGSDVAAAPRS